MEPVIELDGVRVFHGDCRDVLAVLPDNSVDSIVTDPPYELGFMGKSWDASGIAYDSDVWGQCLRVLKPGGHLLAFGGTRTWHRLAVAVEDAGFEVRDSIAWMYGSGFPKSLDVSKAIDKGQGVNRDRQLQFTAWMRSTGITAEQINEATGTAMASHYLTEKSQPAIATADLFDKLRPYLPEVPEAIERLVAERTGIEWTAYKQREVIGQKAWSNSANHFVPGENHKARVNLDETAPATLEAEKWQGWGTALKPAFEPIVVARKPLSGTVAETVLEWGTGGLNIDGSRIAGGERPLILSNNEKSANAFGDGLNGSKHGGTFTQGRWPANVILDEVTAGLLDEQSGNVKGQVGMTKTKGGHRFIEGDTETVQKFDYGKTDSGGASRFFYCSKASKRDRNEGLEDLEAQRHADRVTDDGVGGDNPRNRSNQAKQNFHPTVKPTALMRYLVKLVTPPGGTVLDPFTGSGSTGKAAILEGFDFVGVELTDDYLPIIEGRLKWALENQDEGTLF
jgi:DNA modification methylase